MIELKLYVSDIDFDALIRLFGGNVGGMAALAARAMPEGAKEELAVKYMNSSAGKLERMLENAIAAKGVHMDISGAQASVVPR